MQCPRLFLLKWVEGKEYKMGTKTELPIELIAHMKKIVSEKNIPESGFEAACPEIMEEALDRLWELVGEIQNQETDRSKTIMHELAVELYREINA